MKKVTVLCLCLWVLYARAQLLFDAPCDSVEFSMYLSLGDEWSHKSQERPLALRSQRVSDNQRKGLHNASFTLRTDVRYPFKNCNRGAYVVYRFQGSFGYVESIFNTGLYANKHVLGPSFGIIAFPTRDENLESSGSEFGTFSNNGVFGGWYVYRGGSQFFVHQLINKAGKPALTEAYWLFPHPKLGNRFSLSALYSSRHGTGVGIQVKTVGFWCEIGVYANLGRYTNLWDPINGNRIVFRLGPRWA